MSDQDQPQPEPRPEPSSDEKPAAATAPIPGRRSFGGQSVVIGQAESEQAADQWAEDGRWRRWP